LRRQAIHLLARSKEKNSRVEEANLDWIMSLLTRSDARLELADQERLPKVLDEGPKGAPLASVGISLQHLQHKIP